jgi:hypothetical protein
MKTTSEYASEIERINVMILCALQQDVFDLSLVLKSLSDDILSKATGISENTDLLVVAQQQQEHAKFSERDQALLDWLSPLDFSARQDCLQ